MRQVIIKQLIYSALSTFSNDQIFNVYLLRTPVKFPVYLGHMDERSSCKGGSSPGF